GRPWQALRTPLMIFVRLKGSVTPLRFTTARTAYSTVVKRLPHSGHARRRRISAPSSASRESTTRESAWRQYGQRTAISLREPLPRRLQARRNAASRWSQPPRRRERPVDNRGGHT